MKATAGARFNASHRLAAKDRLSNLSLALFSAVLLSISIITLAFDFEVADARALTVGSAIAAVMALVFSLKTYADRHAVEAEQMHRCSLEINEIRRKYSILDMSNVKIYSKAADEYNLVLQKFSINHSDKDYQKYKYEHRWEFEDLKQKPNFLETIDNSFRSFSSNFYEKFTFTVGIIIFMLIFTEYFYSLSIF